MLLGDVFLPDAPEDARSGPARALHLRRLHIAPRSRAGARHRRTRHMKRKDVPREVLSKLRLVCLDLPEAYEEAAWAGTRWMVSKKNFAHVLMIDDGWPPAYVQAAGSAGP